MNNNTGKGTLPKEPMSRKGKKRRNEEDGASPSKSIRIDPPSAKEPIPSTSSHQEVTAIASNKSSLQEATTKDLPPDGAKTSNEVCTIITITKTTNLPNFPFLDSDVVVPPTSNPQLLLLLPPNPSFRKQKHRTFFQMALWIQMRLAPPPPSLKPAIFLNYILWIQTKRSTQLPAFRKNLISLNPACGNIGPTGKWFYNFKWNHHHHH